MSRHYVISMNIHYLYGLLGNIINIGNETNFFFGSKSRILHMYLFLQTNQDYDSLTTTSRDKSPGCKGFFVLKQLRCEKNSFIYNK